MKLNPEDAHKLLFKFNEGIIDNLNLLSSNGYAKTFLTWLYKEGYLIVKKERQSDSDG